MHRVIFIIVIFALSACTSQKKNSDSKGTPQKESILWNMMHPTIKVGNDGVALESAMLELKKYRKIILMTAVPNSYCHLNMEEKNVNNFNKELGFDGDVGNYFNSLFVQELVRQNIDVEVIDPIDYFGKKVPFFFRSYKTKDGLSSYPEIKSRHRAKLEKLASDKNAALLVMLYINESTHGKEYRNDCYGIRYVTKILTDKKTNHIHSPSWMIYSLSNGERLEKISATLNNEVDMPQDLNDLSKDYIERVLNLLEKEFRKEVTKGILGTVDN